MSAGMPALIEGRMATHAIGNVIKRWQMKLFFSPSRKGLYVEDSQFDGGCCCRKMWNFQLLWCLCWAITDILFSTFWARAATPIFASQCKLNVFQRDLDLNCMDLCWDHDLPDWQCREICSTKVTTGAPRPWGGVLLGERGASGWKGCFWVKGVLLGERGASVCLGCFCVLLYVHVDGVVEGHWWVLGCLHADLCLSM